MVMRKKCSGKLKKFGKLAKKMFVKEEYKKYRSVIEECLENWKTERLLFTRYRKKSIRMNKEIAI